MSVADDVPAGDGVTGGNDPGALRPNRVTPDMKVAAVVECHPHTVEVFRQYGCPDMRKGFFHLVARLMSVRSAARIHRIPLDELMADLNKAARDHSAAPDRSE